MRSHIHVPLQFDWQATLYADRMRDVASAGGARAGSAGRTNQDAGLTRDAVSLRKLGSGEAERGGIILACASLLHGLRMPSCVAKRSLRADARRRSPHAIPFDLCELDSMNEAKRLTRYGSYLPAFSSNMMRMID